MTLFMQINMVSNIMFSLSIFNHGMFLVSFDVLSFSCMKCCTLPVRNKTIIIIIIHGIIFV